MSYIYLSYPEIRNIQFYNSFSYSVKTYNPVRPLKSLDPTLREKTLRMDMDETLWAVSSDHSALEIRMYKALLNSGYSRRIGVLELEVSPRQLLSSFTAIDGNQMFFETQDTLFCLSGWRFCKN